ADLRMPDLSARARDAHALGRSEDALVEVEGARRAVDDHVRRGVVISVRNELHLAHRFPPWVAGRASDILGDCSPPCYARAPVPHLGVSGEALAASCRDELSVAH